MSSNPLNKARELASAIVDSEEYRELKRTEDRIYSDSEAAGVYLKLSRGEIAYSDIDNDNIVHVLKEYEEAANRFNRMMRDINTLISYTIGYTGSKGDCSSCTGCGGK